MRGECDPLVAVLSTFIYDPLVEWGSDKAKGTGGNEDGLKILDQVKSRLQGFSKKKRGLPLSVAGQVGLTPTRLTCTSTLPLYLFWFNFSHGCIRTLVTALVPLSYSYRCGLC
jgi:hypothetical protein